MAETLAAVLRRYGLGAHPLARLGHACPHGEKLRQAKRLCAALAYVGLANLDRVTIVSATEELSGRNVLDLADPSRRGGIQAAISAVFAQPETPVASIMVLRAQDGSERILESIGSARACTETARLAICTPASL